MKNIGILSAAILLFAISAVSQIEGRVSDAKGNGVAKVMITATGEDGTVAATTKKINDLKLPLPKVDPAGIFN